ncbi:MAG: hypothetical protein HY096_09860 [Nitrospinae bacterium]|nr:hypothetical protein [Nitrospinota bacterium]
MTDEELKKETERIVAESTEQRPIKLRAKRGTYKYEVDRYQSLLEDHLGGFHLTEADEEFMRRYEAGMDETEKVRFEEFERLYKSMNERG